MKYIIKGTWKHGSVLIGIAVSGALLFLALKGVGIKEAAISVSRAQTAWIIPMGGVILTDLVLRALRWRLLLPRQGLPAPAPARIWQLLKLEAIGLAINNVTFLRIGELARAYLAAKEFGIPTLTSIATIMIERSLDMTALALLFAAAAWSRSAVIPAAVGETAFLAALGLIAALVALSFSGRFPSSRMAARLRSRWPKAYGLLEQAIMGAQALRSWKVSLQVAALSISLWLVDAGLYWTGARAMRLQPALDYGHSVLVLAAAAASCMLPAVPGSFGTFEQAVKMFLMRLHVEAAQALGYAGFVHVINYLLVTGLGVLFLYQAGHTLASLKTLRRAP